MEKENLMKKIESEEEDDLRPEYDFSQMRGGVRGSEITGAIPASARSRLGGC